jgi:hypothetical protein
MNNTRITVRRSNDRVEVKVKHSFGWIHTSTKKFRFAVLEEHDRPSLYRLKRLLGLVEFQPKATLVPLDRSRFTNHDYNSDDTFTVRGDLKDILRENGYDWIPQQELYEEYDQSELSTTVRRAWRNYQQAQKLSMAGKRMLRSLQYEVEDMQRFDGEVGKEKAMQAASTAIKLCLVLGDDVDAEQVEGADTIYGDGIRPIGL